MEKENWDLGKYEDPDGVVDVWFARGPFRKTPIDAKLDIPQNDRIKNSLRILFNGNYDDYQARHLAIHHLSHNVLNEDICQMCEW